jgi:hypothetical protein
LALDPMTGIAYLVEAFIEYLQSNVSSIPFSISLGAAVVLSLMFIVSFISTAIVKFLLIPAWVFAGVTYFFPSLIPKDHETLSLILFAGMIGFLFIVFKVHRVRLKRSRLDGTVLEIVEWMQTERILNPNVESHEDLVRRNITRIMRKNRVS